MPDKAVRTWIVPLAAILVFFYLLLFTIPYATGYGWAKIPLGHLLAQLWSQPDWGHGMIAPIACVALIWLKWKEIKAVPIAGNSLWGGALIMLGVLIYCVGLKAEMQYFGFAAIQILIGGLILWFWGFRVLVLLSFVWLFFLFTWPMPFLDGYFSVKLRVFMSEISSTFLNILGTHTIQNGTGLFSAPDVAAGLKLGDKFSIDIADPCSGLHSLYALTMISALTAYLTIQNVWLRWVLFFAAIPLAVTGNMVRILMLVWGTEAYGTSFAVGTEENPSAFHMGCGYVVYLVAVILLFALVTFFNSQWMKRQLERLTRHGRATMISEDEAAPSVP